MAERDLIAEILLAHGHGDVRLFRQNTGQGWQGKVLERTRERLVLGWPRPLNAGLCTGSSDLIGWQALHVTPEMVGGTIGRFVAIEAKTGRLQPTEMQRRFLDLVLAFGGAAGVARSAADAAAILASGGPHDGG